MNLFYNHSVLQNYIDFRISDLFISEFVLKLFLEQYLNRKAIEKWDLKYPFKKKYRSKNRLVWRSINKRKNLIKYIKRSMSPRPQKKESIKINEKSYYIRSILTKFFKRTQSEEFSVFFIHYFIFKFFKGNKYKLLWKQNIKFFKKKECFI